MTKLAINSPEGLPAEFGINWKNWLFYLWAKVVKVRTFSASLAPSSVAANTSAEQTFSVPGLNVNDIVHVNKPTADAGIVVGNARVSAADTLAITYGNLTGGSLTPAAETYTITAIRKD